MPKASTFRHTPLPPPMASKPGHVRLRCGLSKLHHIITIVPPSFISEHPPYENPGYAPEMCVNIQSN